MDMDTNYPRRCLKYLDINSITIDEICYNYKDKETLTIRTFVLALRYPILVVSQGDYEITITEGGVKQKHAFKILSTTNFFDSWNQYSHKTAEQSDIVVRNFVKMTKKFK